MEPCHVRRVCILGLWLVAVIFTSCARIDKPKAQNLIGIIHDKTQVSGVPVLKHKILRDEVYDSPLKTQITQDVLVLDDITESKLETLLFDLYVDAKERCGFKHASHPNRIYIYAYVSEEHARSGMGQWIGMLHMEGEGAAPKTELNQAQLHPQTNDESKSFGLTESQRKSVFQEIVHAEDIARSDADKAKLKAVIALRYGVTIDNLSDIAVEGMQKDWPLPLPPEE
ncbi:MAG TPA: hypothetical protein VGL38_01290 [bacterium]|jgi:hypothetical protein